MYCTAAVSNGQYTIYGVINTFYEHILNDTKQVKNTPRITKDRGIIMIYLERFWRSRSNNSADLVKKSAKTLSSLAV